MNNDLISREALKEQFTEGAYTSKGVREIIDNAPTVDIKDQIAGAYNEGYMCGSREAEKARPQDEYVNNMPNCLHLWRCRYKEMVLPPSFMVGLRKGQTISELKAEIDKYYKENGYEHRADT